MRKGKTIGIVAALCGMAGAAIGIILNTMGVFYTPVAEGLGVSVGQVSLYTSISSFVGAVFSIIYPRILTEKNYRKLMYTGMIVAIGGLIAMSAVTKLWQLYVLAPIMYMGQICFSLYIITVLLNSSIRDNVGTITGFVVGFSGITGAVCSPILTKVISAYGWRIGYRAMAALAAVFLIPSVFAPFEFKEGTKSEGQNKQKFNYLQKLFIVTTFVYVLAVVLTAMPQHFVGYSQTRGFDSSTGAFMLSAAMIGNILFKLIAGMLKDRFGTKTALFTVIVVAILGMFMLVFGSGKVILLIGAFLYGSNYSANAVLFPLLARETFGAENYKYTYPVAGFFGAVLMGFATSGIGFIYDFTGSYIPAFFTLAGFSMINLILILWLMKNPGHAEQSSN